MAQNSPTQPAAASEGLLPISQAPAAQLAGYSDVLYLPQDDLLQEPLVIAGTILGDLVLRPGAKWRRLPTTPHTLKFDENPKADRGGTRYQVKVQARRQVPDGPVLAALAGLTRRKLLLLVREHAGGLRLVGSRDEHVLLLAGTEGQHPGNRAGVDLELAGETTRLAPYYKGAVPTAEGSELPADDAGAGTGVITVVDRAGNIMASVPAGATLVIASGFRVHLTIQ